MKKFFLLFLVIFSGVISAQLTLNLTGTPENCPSQASLSWTVSNKTEGSSVNYTISRSTPSGFTTVTTSNTSLGGLTAGTYTVLATETYSSGGNTVTNTASSTYVITSTYTPFSYDALVVPESCANDGFANITITGGKAPYTYKVTQSTTTIIPPTVTSSTTFSILNLSQGIYRIEITDACGTGIIKDINVTKKDNWLTKITNLDVYRVDDASVACNASKYTFEFTSAVGTTPNQFLNKPITATITYTNPVTGQQEVKTHIFNGNILSTYYSDKTITRFDVPFELPYFEVPVTATVTLTDKCGVSYTDSEVIFQPNLFDISTAINTVSCGSKYATLWGMFNHGSTTITEVLKDGQPFSLATSNFQLNQPFTGNVRLGSATEPLAPGIYSVTGVNACGKTDTSTFTITADTSLKVPSYRARTSCQNGFSNVEFFFNQVNGVYISTFVRLEITSAPSAYTGPTVFTPAAGSNAGLLLLPNLPDGSYVFKITNSCGQTYNLSPITFTQVDKVQNYNVTLAERCGTFDINIADQISSNIETSYYLMIYDEATGNWVNPTNPSIIYQNGIPTYYQYRNQSYKLIKGNNLNLQFKGKMRVMRSFKTDIQSSEQICHTVLKEFNIDGGIAFESAFAFYCVDGKYDVAVNATGSNTPLTYKIISKDGVSVDINNGTNSIFQNLDAGVYDFVITDNCGNRILRRLDIASLNPPQIKPVQICSGQDGTLTVDGIQNVNYRWYKKSDPTVTLSTTNVLTLANFNPSTDAGIYAVALSTAPDTQTSCINTTLEFTVTASPTDANAGSNQTHNICYPNAAIDLLNYIDPAASTYGTFTAITPNPYLSNTIFFANNAPAGEYQFLYTVAGCAGTTTSTIIINTKENTPPVITACPQDIYLENDSATGAVATFADPVVTDNCSVKSIVASIPSGSTFLPGTTKVTFSAIDPSGNTAICTFNVTVQTPLTATNETFTYSGTNSFAGNVLLNDSFNGATPNTDLISLTPGTATPVTPGAPVPVLEPNGAVTIPTGTPPGTYTINYTICQKSDAKNCASAVATVVVQNAVCNKPGNFTGTPAAAPRVGITNLNKFRNTGWPGNLNSGFLAVDGINKGMTLTRNADPSANIATPVEGMIVWDTTQNCLSLYTAEKGWHCVQQGCNE